MIDEKRLMNNNEARTRVIKLLNKFIATLESRQGTELYSEEAALNLEAYKEAVAVLENHSDWIPVSQDKPETFETVLLAAKLPEEKEYLTYQGAKEGTRYQLDGVMNDFDYIVAAWQPLPEPYEEVNND